MSLQLKAASILNVHIHIYCLIITLTFFSFSSEERMENAVRFSEQTLKLFIRPLCVLHFLARRPPLICENNDVLWGTTPLPP